MNRTTAWYRGLGPVTTALRCGDESHSITWHAGRLVLADHDLAAESALAAFGANPCPCLDVVELCRRLLPTLGPFSLWTPDLELAGMAARLSAPSNPNRLADERRVEVLRGLSVAFRRRLALAAFVWHGRRPEETAPWLDPPLASVLSALLTPAVLSSAHGGPGANVARPDVRWVAVPRDQPVRCEGWVDDRGGYVRVWLRASWVAEVWVHGLACGQGWLALDRRGGRLAVVEWTGTEVGARREFGEVSWRDIDELDCAGNGLLIGANTLC